MASLTINTSAAEDGRIVAAVGGILQLGRNATAAEVKAFIVARLKAAVSNYERSAGEAAVTVPSPIAPT